MLKKLLIAMPSGLLEQVDLVAKTEHRTRSDLVREALRRYVEEFKCEQSAQMIQSAPREKIVFLLPQLRNLDHRTNGDVFGAEQMHSVQTAEMR